VPRLAIVLGLAAALALAFGATAQAQTAQLLPGVTYEDDVQFTPHGPVSIHVVKAPRPVGPYRLRPVLSNESVTRRETLSAMERRLSSQGAAVGINGDFFSFKDGHPSGLLLRDDALVTPPNAKRSSLGITTDGTIDVRRVRLFGTWRGAGQRRPLTAFNTSPGANGISLFTPDYGTMTPQIRGALAVVLSPFAAATPNTDLVAPVGDSRQNAAVPIEPGTAVLVARGTAAQKLVLEAPLGTNVTVRLILQPDWSGVVDAIGGGPLLLRDGRPVFRAKEAFTTSQLAPRDPRSAVGQLSDGRLVFVAVDGRQAGYSVGLTNFELAQTMMRLGAVRAMALDSGGSTTLAFDGTVLNRPSDGRERAISTALLLVYTGVYAPPPEVEVVSPNGDGVDEEQALAYRVVRPSNVTASLVGPDRRVAFQQAALQQPGTYEVAFPPATVTPGQPSTPAEGRWTFTVSATDDQGVASSTTRRFWVNSTIGFLRLVPRALALPPTGGALKIAWTQTRAARVTVRVETQQGVLLRRVTQAAFEPGENSVLWNGRRKDGRRAYGGVYRVTVTAQNTIGTEALGQLVRVRRVGK
jgi:Phosphodiester glycosidase/FlgD Ig-like domain